MVLYSTIVFHLSAYNVLSKGKRSKNMLYHTQNQLCWCIPIISHPPRSIQVTLLQLTCIYTVFYSIRKSVLNVPISHKGEQRQKFTVLVIILVFRSQESLQCSQSGHRTSLTDDPLSSMRRCSPGISPRDILGEQVGIYWKKTWLFEHYCSH